MPIKSTHIAHFVQNLDGHWLFPGTKSYRLIFLLSWTINLLKVKILQQSSTYYPNDEIKFYISDNVIISILFRSFWERQDAAEIYYWKTFQCDEE